MKVLAVGAHPDDCEYGCFGTLAKHLKRGDEVHLLHVTYGVRGRDPLIRAKEAKKSASILGASSIRFCNFTCPEVCYVRHEVIDAIKESVDHLAPDWVYTHSPYETHQNHWVISKCTGVAARDVDNLLYFETPTTTHEFQPTVYVDIMDTIDTKIKCLKAYRSEFNRDSTFRYGTRFTKTLAGYNFFKAHLGYPSGKQGYAEGFMVRRMILL